MDYLWLLLALTLVRGVIYAVLNPAFGSPDERAHFQYVAYLAGDAAERGTEGLQPVPYYALMVPAYWLTAGHSPAVQNLAVRLASLPFLLGVILFTWLAARRMAPHKPLVPVVAATLAGLHPELAYVAASANNDSAANLMAAVLTYLIVLLLLTEINGLTLLGTAVAIGAALMTKGQILPLVALTSVIMLGCSIRLAATTRRITMGACLALASLLVFLGLRTDAGSFLMHRTGRVLSTLAYWPELIETARREGMEPFGYQLLSFWGAFLGDTVHLPAGWYLAPGAVVACGIAGFGLRFEQRLRHGIVISHRSTVLHGVLLLVLVAQWLPPYITFLAVSDPGILTSDGWILQALQGRYLLPLLPALSLLTAQGWAMFPTTQWTNKSLHSVLLALIAFDFGSILALVVHHSWFSVA